MNTPTPRKNATGHPEASIRPYLGHEPPPTAWANAPEPLPMPPDAPDAPDAYHDLTEAGEVNWVGLIVGLLIVAGVAFIVAGVLHAR